MCGAHAQSSLGISAAADPRFPPEVSGLVFAPFLLYVSDEGVLGGKQAYKYEQLFRGFTVSSLLDSLSWLPL